MKEPNYKYIANLVIKTQQNDSNAFAELFGLTHNKVYTYACHYLKDTYLAQDAVQEVYISVLKNIHKLKDPSLFVAWLNQISFHICFDMCKKRNHEYGVISDGMLDLLNAREIPQNNPESQTLLKDEASRLRSAIQQLPYHEREIIVLRYYNNMKIDEIAQVTDLSKSTVKRYLASGQSTLKYKMKG